MTVTNLLNNKAMKKISFMFLTFIGLMGLLAGCEKDETQAVMLDNPIPPRVATWPDLNLSVDDKADTLIFIGIPVDMGFTASANYILEAGVPGTDFKPATRIFYGDQDTLMTITEEKLNKALNKKFLPGVASPIEFRIRCVLVVDSGTKALGSSSNPLEVKSETFTVTVVTY